MQDFIDSQIEFYKSIQPDIEATDEYKTWHDHHEVCEPCKIAGNNLIMPRCPIGRKLLLSALEKINKIVDEKRNKNESGK